MDDYVYTLFLSFKFDFEHVHREFVAIGRAVKRWSRPVMHGKKTAGFVIVTNESQNDLFERLKPILEYYDSLDNYWIISGPVIVEAKYGSIDPFRTAVNEGWARVRQRRYPQHVRQGERR